MPNQADLVACDARLANLLGEKVVKLASLSERIGPMLTRVPTPVLDYTIRWACCPPLHNLAESSMHQHTVLGLARGWTHRAELAVGLRRRVSCRTQGKARRECFDIDIEVPLRPGEDRAPPAAHDPEIDSVRPSICCQTSISLLHGAWLASTEDVAFWAYLGVWYFIRGCAAA